MALLTVCTGTPTITVRDNRGQAVRTLRYNRSVAGGVATQCIERNTFNDLGQPGSSQDARFFAQGGSSPTLNFQHTPALSGQVLQTVSADAGQTQTFHDIAGRLVWQRDARGTVQTYTYDALGRPLTRSEQVDGTGPTYVRERWTYGDAQAPEATYDATDANDSRNLNLRGQLVQHYDTAGLLDHSARGFTMQGPVQQAVRTLALDPQAEIDWNAAGLATHWPGVLDTMAPYPTSWQYNALGQALAQTDAAGHQRRTTYDLAGRLFSSTVTLKGGSPQSVVRTQTYNAAGQVLVKQMGSGVTTIHTYEPQLTQRLLTITTTRDSDHLTLQSQQYTYDPVGNVTALRDPLSQPQYFKGQAVSPDKTYTYDALYQLIQATGRQNATGTPMDTGTPAGILSPSDPINLQSYTRSYSYDQGGNLTQVSLNGTGANRQLVVAPGSNRALSNANLPALNAGAVDTYFDAAGNANCLDGNKLQPLTWSGLNQLQSVTFVYRNDQDDTENDRERYVYGGDGQRVRKTRYAMVGGTYSQQQDDVIYLPGLELRRQGSAKTLEVMVLDGGARLLYWTAGAPAGIANPQLRLASQDRLGSCSLELDAAGQLITQEEYFPYGGTAVLAAATPSDVDNKTIRYSGKERDATGLYYYGFRYYQPWIGRWLNTDPAGTVDGLNLYCMVGNNPATLIDSMGAASDQPEVLYEWENGNSDPPEDLELGNLKPGTDPQLTKDASLIGDKLLRWADYQNVTYMLNGENPFNARTHFEGEIKYHIKPETSFCGIFKQPPKATYFINNIEVNIEISPLINRAAKHWNDALELPNFISNGATQAESNFFISVSENLPGNVSGFVSNPQMENPNAWVPEKMKINKNLNITVGAREVEKILGKNSYQTPLSQEDARHIAEIHAYKTLLHEFGHVLGLHHPPNQIVERSAYARQYASKEGRWSLRIGTFKIEPSTTPALDQNKPDISWAPSLLGIRTYSGQQLGVMVKSASEYFSQVGESSRSTRLEIEDIRVSRREIHTVKHSFL